MSSSKAEKKKDQNFSKDFDYQWSRRILVVDDEVSITQAYKDILSPPKANVVPLRSSRSSGEAVPQQAISSRDLFEVDQAHSFEQGLHLFKQALQQGRPYTMGFFDVKLGGGKDGVELVKEIQSMDEEIYAVIVTAYNDRTVDSILNYLGPERLKRWDYLNKPFTEGEILQKARNFVSLWNLQRERVQREAQLTDVREKLMDSERFSTVAAVARGVTHEFGNILMQIMGKADLYRNKSPEQMSEALGKILEASQRASDILEKFKDLSGSAAEIHQPKELVELHSLLDEAIGLIEHQLKTHSIKVTKVKVDKVSLKAHPTSILQVFINVFLNALYAMESSGQLDLSIVDQGEWVEVRIRDYGPGIASAHLDRVLEPFFTTKGSQGTGLGLPICKEIVEIEHQGEFGVSNHGVKGLEVKIRLPKNGGES